MSKLSDSINTSINSFKQRERFDDSKDIKKDVRKAFDSIQKEFDDL